MILQHGLIFNRFGDEKEKTADYVNETQLELRLIKLQNDFSVSAKQIFTKIEDHVKKTEELLKVITVDKNYISLNNKRVVSVSRAINKNDVVIKSQLDSASKTCSDLIHKRITENSKEFDKFKVGNDDHIKKLRDNSLEHSVNLNNHISEFGKLKNITDQHIQKFENYHIHIKDTFQEILEKQEQHDNDITALKSKP